VTKDFPETGKQWIEKYREEYGDGWAKGFAHQAVIGANGRGAEDVLKVLTLFKDDLRGISRTQGTYAEDFDFHLLVTRQPTGHDFGEAVIRWAARDKEAAWSAVDELIKAGQTRGAIYVGSVFRGIVALEGDEKATAWMMGKLDQVPAESRERAITALTRYPLPGETVAGLVRAMRTEEERVLFTAAFAKPYRGESAVDGLRALGTEDLQARALARSAGEYAGYAATGNPPDQKTRDFFSATMDKLNFSPAAREKVEAALPPAADAGE